MRRDRVWLARRAFPWLERDREPRAIEDSGQPLPSLQLLLRERLRLTGLVGDRQSPGGSELEPGKLELQPLRPLDADGIVAWLELGIEVGHGLGRRVRRDDRARDRGRLRLRAIHGHRAQEEGRQRQNGGLAKFRDHCRFPFAYIATMSAISPVLARPVCGIPHWGFVWSDVPHGCRPIWRSGPPGRRQRGNEDALHASESSVSVEVRQSIHERVLDQDRVVAVGAGGQQRHRALDQLLQALDVLDRVGGELGEAAGAARVGEPACRSLKGEASGDSGYSRRRREWTIGWRSGVMPTTGFRPVCNFPHPPRLPQGISGSSEECGNGTEEYMRLVWRKVWSGHANYFKRRGYYNADST